MRIIALACLAAVAASQEVLQIGYGLGNDDLQFTLGAGTKIGTGLFTLSVPPEAQFNGQAMATNNNWFLSYRFQLSGADCPNCANALYSAYYRFGAAADASDIRVLGPVTGANIADGAWADVPLQAPTTVAQTVSLFINVTCSLCSKSAELSRLEAIVRYMDSSMPASPPVFGSFAQDSDRNTDVFRGPAGTWGPVVRITPAITATDYVIVVPEIPVTAVGSGVVFYFSPNATGFAAGIAAYDGTTLTCATSANGCANVGVFTAAATTNFLRAPASAYSSGAFSGAATQLGASRAGTWYIAPFITKKASVGSTAAYQFAIGLNAVPAAAAGVVPSFIIVAAATLFAALRV